jgi:mannose-6-phosphate isomerase
MAFEKAAAQLVAKPWGRLDLKAWTASEHVTTKIGEIWFERTTTNTALPHLSLKLLFTSEPLSIQVHPNDAQAQAEGHRNGKTEAWYVLDAADGSHVDIGLSQPMSESDLRAAILDGSIANAVKRQSAAARDTFIIPAGTIHGIGAGLVIAEIQQRCDETYHLFDHGRRRDLHIDKAVAVARRTVAAATPGLVQLSNVRSVLAATPYFVLERLDLPRRSTWQLDATYETWVLVLDGKVRVGETTATTGDAFFLEHDVCALGVDATPAVALIAYAIDEPQAGLLKAVARRTSFSTGRNHLRSSSLDPLKTQTKLSAE